MPDGNEPKPLPAGRNLLFLREEELRLAQDLLFFGYRDFTAGADAILAEIGDMGRAHHRVLHFVGRCPGITVWANCSPSSASPSNRSGAVLSPSSPAATSPRRKGARDPPPAPAAPDGEGRGPGAPPVREAAGDGDARLSRGRASGGGGLPQGDARVDGAGGARPVRPPGQRRAGPHMSTPATPAHGPPHLLWWWTTMRGWRALLQRYLAEQGLSRHRRRGRCRRPPGAGRLRLRPRRAGCDDARGTGLLSTEACGARGGRAGADADGRRQPDDRVAGFEHGADDYLPKPFDPRELALRIRTPALRRTAAAAPPPGAPVQLGTCGSTPTPASRAGAMGPSALTPGKPPCWLCACRPGEVLSREEIAAALGTPDAGERGGRAVYGCAARSSPIRATPASCRRCHRGYGAAAGAMSGTAPAEKTAEPARARDTLPARAPSPSAG